MSAASTIVGGFTGDDARLYRNGLQHVANVHGRIGSLTIGQIVDQERSREQSRIAAAGTEHDAHIASLEDEDMAAALNLLKQSEEGNALIRGHVVDGYYFKIAIDQDVWDTMGEQDREMFKDVMIKAWRQTYRSRHGPSSDGIGVILSNLADRQVDSVYENAGG